MTAIIEVIKLTKRYPRFTIVFQQRAVAVEEMFDDVVERR
jgi:hypothetical protein